MKTRTKPRTSRGAAKLIRSRIAKGGDRVWRFSDFSDLPVAALAQALSRLTRQGELRRLSKGVYYRSRQTALGRSAPNPTSLRKLVGPRNAVFPAGVAAANLLGFTTQAASRSEVATNSLSLPRKLIGADTVIHTRRPEAWTRLSESDAALLDFLRRGAKTSDLSPHETVSRTIALFRQPGRFGRLLRISRSEPPRVRAMMGAIGDVLGQKPAALKRLRASLNPLSRFDFGMLTTLPSAGHWQAMRRRIDQRFGGAGEVAGQILVEAGTASGREPTATVELRSYVATFLQDNGLSLGAEDETGFPMRLLHFRRTFVEKLFAIHSKVALLKREGRPLGPYARHYYDLFQLAARSEVAQMLASAEYAAIKADYDEISRAHFAQSYLPPDAMSFATSEALFPPEALSRTLSAEYERQCRQLCLGPYPPWAEVRQRFEQMRALL